MTSSLEKLQEKKIAWLACGSSCPNIHEFVKLQMVINRQSKETVNSNSIVKCRVKVRCIWKNSISMRVSIFINSYKTQSQTRPSIFICALAKLNTRNENAMNIWWKRIIWCAIKFNKSICEKKNEIPKFHLFMRPTYTMYYTWISIYTLTLLLSIFHLPQQIVQKTKWFWLCPA